jgi:hypothetical protein
MPPVPEASSILASLGQAAFVWDLIADTIAWSDNAGAVFTDIPAEALASGAVRCAPVRKGHVARPLQHRAAGAAFS